jgi:hypothetical protein
MFREEYTGTTLREHYGLARPASVYSSAVKGLPETASAPTSRLANSKQT